MPYALSVIPVPLHTAEQFIVRLSITAPDVVDGDDYELRVERNAQVALNTAQVQVPVGAVSPCELDFISLAGFQVDGPFRFAIVKTTDMLTDLATLDGDVLAAVAPRAAAPAVAATAGQAPTSTPNATQTTNATTQPTVKDRVKKALGTGFTIVAYFLPTVLVAAPILILGWIAWYVIQATPDTQVNPPAATSSVGTVNGNVNNIQNYNAAPTSSSGGSNPP